MMMMMNGSQGAYDLDTEVTVHKTVMTPTLVCICDFTYAAICSCLITALAFLTSLAEDLDV